MRLVSSTRDRSESAVQLLIAAIIQRALDDLRLGARFRMEAAAWLNERRSEEQPGSFEWCCAGLGLDPDTVRKRYRLRLAIRSDPVAGAGPRYSGEEVEANRSLTV